MLTLPTASGVMYAQQHTMRITSALHQKKDSPRSPTDIVLQHKLLSALPISRTAVTGYRVQETLLHRYQPCGKAATHNLHRCMSTHPLCR